MSRVVHILDRPVHLTLSGAADRAAARLETPLVAEMELLFSCMVAKRMHFGTGSNTTGAEVAVHPHLTLAFRATIASTCDPGGGAALRYDTTTVPDLRPYIPKWCRIDWRDGVWHGEFGYDSNAD